VAGLTSFIYPINFLISEMSIIVYRHRTCYFQLLFRSWWRNWFLGFSILFWWKDICST